MLRPILMLMLCAAAGVASAAEIYRWVDDNGVVHYSDRPGVENAQRVDVPGRVPSPAPTSGATPAETAGEAEATASSAPTAGQLAPVGRAASCERSRERLEGLLRADRLFQEGPDGERHYLDEDQVAEARMLAEAQVAHWCD